MTDELDFSNKLLLLVTNLLWSFNNSVYKINLCTIFIMKLNNWAYENHFQMPFQTPFFCQKLLTFKMLMDVWLNLKEFYCKCPIYYLLEVICHFWQVFSISPSLSLNEEQWMVMWLWYLWVLATISGLPMAFSNSLSMTFNPVWWYSNEIKFRQPDHPILTGNNYNKRILWFYFLDDLRYGYAWGVIIMWLANLSEWLTWCLLW